jgi:DNA polymerase III subunit epsilon
MPSSSSARPARPKASGARVFAAIDFETADAWRDSACSVAVVRVEGQRIVHREHHLIRPPRQEFRFSGLHGITWAMVERAPTFDQVWARLVPCLEGVEFLAAHNAPFDRSVLKACCEARRMEVPSLDFACSVRLARQTWGLQKATLPVVCQFLSIPLEKHHDAAADAEACARIVLAAAKAGGALP